MNDGVYKKVGPTSFSFFASETDAYQLEEFGDAKLFGYTTTQHPKWMLYVNLRYDIAEVMEYVKSQPYFFEDTQAMIQHNLTVIADTVTTLQERLKECQRIITGENLC